MKPLCDMSPEEIRKAVADRYSEVATKPSGKFNFPIGRKFAESVGYEPDLLDSIPASFWDSFTGAGNPQPYIDAQPGEVVLDLGCGSGLDLYIYSRAVGPEGRLFGLDLSEEMLSKAKNNLDAVGVSNVEFIHAPSDAIPLPDSSVDLVTANGIYNLSPDKEAVMNEVVRVLRPGGRTIFAEIILKDALPEEIRTDINDWFRCIGGALTGTDFIASLEKAGFEKPEILWCGRNARTGHELAMCSVIRARVA